MIVASNVQDKQRIANTYQDARSLVAVVGLDDEGSARPRTIACINFMIVLPSRSFVVSGTHQLHSKIVVTLAKTSSMIATGRLSTLRLLRALRSSTRG